MLKYSYLGVVLVLGLGSAQAQPMGNLVDSSSGSPFIQSVRHDHHHRHRWDRDDVWVPDTRWRGDYYYYDDWRYRDNWRYRGDRYRDRDDAKVCLDGIGCVRFD